MASEHPIPDWSGGEGAGNLGKGSQLNAGGQSWLESTQIQAAARQARFDELEVQGVYDGIWANFSLLHAPKSEFPGHLARIRRAGKRALCFTSR